MFVIVNYLRFNIHFVNKAVSGVTKLDLGRLQAGLEIIAYGGSN